eukprot:352528-Chlamydomonas_euryale.AAC.2
MSRPAESSRLPAQADQLQLIEVQPLRARRLQTTPRAAATAAAPRAVSTSVARASALSRALEDACAAAGAECLRRERPAGLEESLSERSEISRGTRTRGLASRLQPQLSGCGGLFSDRCDRVGGFCSQDENQFEFGLRERGLSQADRSLLWPFLLFQQMTGPGRLRWRSPSLSECVASTLQPAGDTVPLATGYRRFGVGGSPDGDVGSRTCPDRDMHVGDVHSRVYRRECARTPAWGGASLVPRPKYRVTARRTGLVPAQARARPRGPTAAAQHGAACMPLLRNVRSSNPRRAPNLRSSKWRSWCWDQVSAPKTTSK